MEFGKRLFKFFAGAVICVTTFMFLFTSQTLAEDAVAGPRFDICIGPNGDEKPTSAYDSANKRFLVVWEEHFDAPSSEIDVYGQLVNRDGTPCGGKILICALSGSQQISPLAAYDSVNHRFLVVWADNRNIPYQTYGRFVNADGTLYGGDFAISPSDMAWADPQCISYDPTLQRFLVLFVPEDVCGQFVNADGSLSGSYFQITTCGWIWPIWGCALGYDSNNARYLVAFGCLGLDRIYGSMLNADGSNYGGGFIISYYAYVIDYLPIPFDPVNNRFLVLHPPGVPDASVRGQLVNANATLYGGEITLYFNQGYEPGSTQAIFDTSKNKFMVTSYSNVPGFSGQLLNPDGSLDGPTFTICDDLAWSPVPLFVTFGSPQTGSLIVWPDDSPATPETLHDIFGKFIRLAPIAPELDPIGDKTVNEGSLLTFKITASDPDSDMLTFSVSNLPQGASFNPSTQTFSWRPTYRQAGTYHNVHFEVSDGELQDSEDITITVKNVNLPPILYPIGNKNVDEGKTLQFTISAIDPDGDVMRYSARNLPQGAQFNPLTRTFSWRPTYTQAGIYRNVHFEVTDGSLIDYENITITVKNINGPPVFDPIGDKLIHRLCCLSFRVHATDPDVERVTYYIVNKPDGAFFDSGTGWFYWTPRIDQAGRFAVTFKARDTFGNETSETITITVPNTPPYLFHIGNKYAMVGRPLIFKLNAYDADVIDRHLVRYYADNLPRGAYLCPYTGWFWWWPFQRGVYRVHFYVKDPPGAIDDEAIAILVL